MKMPRRTVTCPLIHMVLFNILICASFKLYIVIDNSINVVHLGYISLFPFILGLVPSNSPKIEFFLDLITNEQHLWSPFGLRSLSRTSEYFNTGENYWRGP
jgi:hypothetical protein